MSESQVARARSLVSEGRAALRLPVKDSTRTATLLLLFPQILQALEQLAEYHAGFEAEHSQLVALVSELRKATIASTNGAMLWATELPPGKAPGFRRALNAVLAHLRRRA